MVPKIPTATTCFSCSLPDLNSVVTNYMFCIHVKQPLPLGDNAIAVNKYYYYIVFICGSRYFFVVSFHTKVVKKYDLCEVASSDTSNNNHNYFWDVKIQSEDSLPIFRMI